MICCGFDPPSVRNLGYALFDVDNECREVALLDGGIISLHEKYNDEIYDYDYAVKSLKLMDFLRGFYADKKISEIVIEKQVLSKRGNRFSTPFVTVQTNIMANIIQMVACQECISRNVIHNKTLKKHITGNGNAKKSDVMDAVVGLINLDIDYEGYTQKQWLTRFEHTIDAMALVLGFYIGEKYKPISYDGMFVAKELLVE